MRFPKLNAYQKLVELLSLVLTLVTLVYIISIYSALPEQIPGHYNAAGEVTSYTGKGVVWVLAGVEVIMYLLMTVFIFFPRLTENPNTLWVLDARFKEKVAGQTVSLLGECKFLCIALFSYECFVTVRQMRMSTTPIWVLCALMAVSIIVRIRNISKYQYSRT